MSQSNRSDVGAHGLSVSELIVYFCNGWRLLVAFTIAFGALALLIALLLPKKYEASVDLEPARSVISEHLLGFPFQTSVRWDTPADLSQRLRSPAYFSDLTVSVCSDGQKDRQFVDWIRPYVGHNSPFLRLSIHAPAPELAKACLEAIIVDVIEQQRSVLDPLLVGTNGKLVALRKQLFSIGGGALTPELNRHALEDMDSNEIVTARMLLNSLDIISNINYARELRERIAALELMLSPPFTHGALVSGPIYSPERAVFPDVKLFVVTGLALGLMLGFVFLLFKRAMPARIARRDVVEI